MRAMYARLTAVLVFASAMSSRTASAEQAVPVHEIRLGLFGACAPSAQVGWVVGDLGRVYRTADAGKTWTPQEVAGKRPVFSISCPDDQHAWVSSTSGAIFATSDGGNTWKAQQTPAKRNLFKVVFTTPQNGTAVGDFGIIVHTADGGRTPQAKREQRAAGGEKIDRHDATDDRQPIAVEPFQPASGGIEIVAQVAEDGGHVPTAVGEFVGGQPLEPLALVLLVDERQHDPDR